MLATIVYMQTRDTITIDGFVLHVIRKRVKNINVRIKPPNADIEVSMPLSVPMSELERFVAKHRKWIVDTQAKVKSAPASVAELATEVEKKEWRAYVEAFVPPLVEHWEKIIGVKSTKIAYRNMKSRWGSCQPSTGRICFNTRLALYPVECLEYVVVHELCHLVVRGHGKDFHALMDYYLPDWKMRKRLLSSSD